MILLEVVEHQQYLVSLVEEGDIHLPTMNLQNCQKMRNQRLLSLTAENTGISMAVNVSCSN